VTFFDFDLLSATSDEIVWGLRHKAYDCRVTFWRGSQWEASYELTGHGQHKLIGFDTPEAAVEALVSRVRV